MPVAALALALPAAAIAAFPGSDPGESVRANAPNDPGFDPCEQDNDGGAECSNPFDEEVERFGFAPSATQFSATYKNPSDTARQQEQNTLAGRNPLGQLSGVSADRAWKLSTGRPDVQVAILDTGIRWEDQDLRTKVALNRRELPEPQRAGGAPCPGYDCNGDGAFNVDDYAADARVRQDAGVEPADKLLDAGDLIATFSDGKDDDGNGYADDVAGWDFFDDDNDPFDASSYSSANNHGSGRAEEAAGATNDGRGGTGVCPRCTLVPMRVWDTFVVDMQSFGQAVLYAADNDVEVVEAATGGLTNTRFAREAFAHAYRSGVFFAIVSSDLNTADHNIPTLYDEAMQVQGTVADAHGLGQDADQLGPLLGALGVPSSAPVGTWFRNSGTTQYGGHAHVVMPAPTGSQATGQAAGAAGLLIGYARDRGIRLAPNEVKQVLTTTAEDVVAENTVGSGVPDPAQPGWDQHFGYGRPDLGLALERIRDGRVPPQALIDGPEWFAPLNVARQSSFDVVARLSARTSFKWRLQWAPGIEPAESEFRDVGAERTASGPVDGELGTISLGEVRAALDARPGGGAADDPTAPSKGPGDPDPNEPAFTVRVVVTDADGNRGEDRKVLFAYRDTSLARGWSRYDGTGGEASQRMFDLDGDNLLDIVSPDSSGDLHVLRENGKPLQSFNGGEPVRTRRYSNVHPDAPSYRGVEPPRESLRNPAIGDVDGDREPEIVDAAGEHVYAWNADGSEVDGFPVRVDPDLSKPSLRTKTNHIKRGFIGSPTLVDLDGDGRLDVAVPSLDQHLYAWTGRGERVRGFPTKLKSPDEKLDGAETINSAAAGDVNGDGRPELVVPTAEIDDPIQQVEGDVASAVRGIVIAVAANAIGKSGRTYAVSSTGKILPGWPVKPNGAVPDALPLVGPGVDYVLGDVDGDGALEAIGGVATGDVQARRGDGSVVTTYDSGPGGGEHVDKSRVLNLFEHPIVADLDGDGGLEVIKGGLTLNQLLNIGVVPGQNLPYNHVVQAWNARTGESLPAYPQAVEDFQLLSSPAVADVSDAPGNEVVVGTGLYYLRNLAADGTEGSGWPKFTGGWLLAVPAIGDVDGDDRLEVVARTREGWSFLWETDRPACGTNDEWWTARHDEWGTGAYGTDSRPPGTPDSFRVKAGKKTIALSWKAPGDDWSCGKAAHAVVLVSDRPIRHPDDGRTLARLEPKAAGGEQSLTVKRGRTRRYYAVLYEDDAGNWGHAAGLTKSGTGSSSKPALKVSVRPRRVAVRRRTCFRLRVTSRGRPVRGAKVHIGGKGTARTDRRGRARLCRRYFTAGRRTASAARGGYRSARASIEVAARRR
ncbi:MAG TPA: S8 family serine peptidase [Thermoleophilaceae bacterium]